MACSSWCQQARRRPVVTAKQPPVAKPRPGTAAVRQPKHEHLQPTLEVFRVAHLRVCLGCRLVHDHAGQRESVHTYRLDGQQRVVEGATPDLADTGISTGNKYAARHRYFSVSNYCQSHLLPVSH